MPPVSSRPLLAPSHLFGRLRFGSENVGCCFNIAASASCAAKQIEVSLIHQNGWIEFARNRCTRLDSCCFRKYLSSESSITQSSDYLSPMLHVIFVCLRGYFSNLVQTSRQSSHRVPLEDECGRDVTCVQQHDSLMTQYYNLNGLSN